MFFVYVKQKWSHSNLNDEQPNVHVFLWRMDFEHLAWSAYETNWLQRKGNLNIAQMVTDRKFETSRITARVQALY